MMTEKKLDLEKIGSGSLANVGRPPVDARKGIAEDIRNRGGFYDMLDAETTLRENPLCFCGTPVLDEAEAEKQEGGGPIFDAVEWFKEEAVKEEATA